MRTPLAARRRRGAAVLLALAVLAVTCAISLAVLGALRLERRASGNSLLLVRARLAAQAGVARAAIELDGTELDDPTGTSGAWLLPDPGVSIDAPGCFVSWNSPDVFGACTGRLGGSLVGGGDRYLVRAADTSSRLDANAPASILGPALDALGRALELQRSRTAGSAPDPVRGRGNAIAQWIRARGRLSSVRELAQLLDPEDARVLEGFLTTTGVLDRGAHRVTRLDQRGYPVASLDPVAPVCLNTASWPVLVAVLTNVTGEDAVPITLAQATVLADWIVAWRSSIEADRGPFTTWESFARLVDGASRAAGLSPAQRDAVLANANPNLAAAELNPDGVVLRMGDAARLRHATARFSLITSGVYEIDSLGRVLGPDGEIAAEARVHATVRVFETLRHSTQRDFEEAGTCEGTCVMPSTTGEPPSASLGWVQLAPRAPGSLDGVLLGYSDAVASRDRAKDPGKHRLARTSLDDVAHKTAPGPVNGTPRDRIHRDGLLVSSRLEPICYSPDPLADSGAVSFWVKLGHDTTRATLLDGEHLAPDGTGTCSRMVASRTGDALLVEFERVTGVPGKPWSTTRTRASLPGMGAAHEWHHVALAFSGRDHQLAVDGLPLRADPAVASPPLWVSRSRLALGGTLDGVSSAAAATIDAVVIERAGSRASLEDRFGLDGTVVGRFHGRFGPLDSDVEIGTLSWTELRPTHWGDVSFREDEFQVATEVEFSGTKIKAKGNGSPVSWAHRKNPPLPPQAGGKANGRGKSKLTASNVPPTSNGAPRIVHRGDPILYEFEFTYDREALRRRGVVPPPLAVTPVLEDVTLTFTRGTKVLHLEELD